MRRNRVTCAGILGVVLGVLVVIPAFSAEILVEDDFKQNIVKGEQLVRVADNAIFLFDSSSSMKAKLQGTDETRLAAVLREFKARNARMPEIGHKFGLYGYTPWKEYYPLQTYNREKFAAALDALPTTGGGQTLLREGLMKTEPLLDKVSGKTAIYVFTDGGWSRDFAGETRGTPLDIAKRMIQNHDVCFYVISTAKEKANTQLVKAIAQLNACSRLLPLKQFLDRPEYNAGALFRVKPTETIVTTTEKKVVGIKAENVTFEYDKSDIQTKDHSELDEVGKFMNEHPDTFIVLEGHTDNKGGEEYNLALSRRRAESAASYLMNRHGIDASRIVVNWYGFDAPIASNDTEAGRAKNRRVEIAVGML
jgi:OOP family OmpA-OmpF porin